jgi:hypothetical protein
VVRLSPEERGGLEAMIRKGKSAAARLLKARILLKIGLASGKWRALLRERGAFHGQAAASVDAGFRG